MNNPYQLIGHVIRPPAEHNSVILQLMEGCPHNKCTFCGTYRETKFKVKTDDEFEQHVQSALNHYSANKKRIFISDGDVMSLPFLKIVSSINIVKKYFSNAGKFGFYSRAEGILKFSKNELQAINQAGVSTLYLGLESGCDDTLIKINKGSTAQDMIDAVKKAQECGIKCSVMGLVGIAGKENSKKHAEMTGKVFSEMKPRFISLLTLFPAKGSEIYDEINNKSFTMLSETERLKETKEILKNINNTKSIFRADHASNLLPLSGTLPKDKARLLSEIDLALQYLG